MGPDAIILVFWMLSFKPAFSLSFALIKKPSFFSAWATLSTSMILMATVTREAWHAAVHRVTKSGTGLSDWTTIFFLSFRAMHPVAFWMSSITWMIHKFFWSPKFISKMNWTYSSYFTQLSKLPHCHYPNSGQWPQGFCNRRNLAPWPWFAVSNPFFILKLEWSF